MESNNQHVSATAPVRLERGLSLLMATAVVVGTVIGSGVFKKPQSVADNVPNFAFVLLVWSLGGVLALLGSLSLSEVAVLYPRAGGNYVFLREGFGRLWGFLWGWVEFWIIRTASIAALATIVMESLHDVLRTAYGESAEGGLMSYWEERFLTVGLILGLAWVNIRGVRWGGGLQVFITLVKIGSLFAIILLPFLVRGPIESAAAPIVTRGVPDFTWAGLAGAMLGVQWAYHGWMNVAPVAEEIREPQRNIPLAMVGGVGFIIILYLSANAAYHWVIPQSEMRELKSTTVATEFCLRLIGPIGAAFASAAVMCSAFGALNGNILVGPRLLYAMAKDNLIPARLSAVHPRYRTPALAIVVESVWSALLVLGGGALTRYGLPVWEMSEGYEINLNLPPGMSLFDLLTNFAMFAAVIFETLAVATIFVFRARMPNVERPYRCWGYPLVPIIYVAILSVVAAGTLFTQDADGNWNLRTEAVLVMVFVAIGGAVYAAILRKTTGSSAANS